MNYSDIHVGDRVRVVDETDYFAGEAGTVLEIRPGRTWGVRVRVPGRELGFHPVFDPAELEPAPTDSGLTGVDALTDADLDRLAAALNRAEVFRPDPDGLAAVEDLLDVVDAVRAVLVKAGRR